MRLFKNINLENIISRIIKNANSALLFFMIIISLTGIFDLFIRMKNLINVQIAVKVS